MISSANSQQQQMQESQVIVVDENDNQIGICNKYEAHRTETGPKLHRAFSLFLFDPQEGRLLLQRRSKHKLTFPMIWANTCCSHPNPNENILDASKRRAQFELNIDLTKISDLKEIGIFLYKAEWNEWTEYEVDHVVFATYNINYKIDRINFNKDEVSEVKWVTPNELANMIDTDQDSLSPWLKKIYTQWLIPNWEIWVSSKSIETTTTIVRL